MQLIANTRFVALFVILIVVSGLSALKTLPRVEDPRTSNRSALILTPFPGASAERVEALVTEPIEKRLREIPEIGTLESRSKSGLSIITVKFIDEVTDDNAPQLWALVRDKLGDLHQYLPSGVGAPKLDDQRWYPFTRILALRWNSDKPVDMSVLGRYAEELESKFSSVRGTDFVKIFGAVDEEILIEVDGAQAALLGVGIHAISQAVLDADAKVSAGELHNRYHRVDVEVEGALDTLDRVRNIPLVTSSNGAIAKISDLASVKRHWVEPSKQLAIIHGERALVVGARILPNQRSGAWGEKIDDAIETFKKNIPTNISIEVIFDQERYTLDRLSQLVKSIGIGFVLIILVLLLTLGWRSALVVGISLPLNVLFTLACMRVVDLPIHQMSVTGLVVALGIMVDNAIIMTDTVNRNRKLGLSPVKAVATAVRHFWLPLLGSTFTTILAFSPLILMSGSVSEFIGGVSVTVIASLIGSYIISQVVVTVFASNLFVLNNKSTWFQHGVNFPWLTRLFAKSIRWSIDNPRRILVFVCMVPLIGFVTGKQVQKQFFPSADRDMLNLEVYLPMSFSIDKTLALTEEVTKEVEVIDGVKNIHWFIGSSSPSFYYNVISKVEGAQYYAQALLTADSYQVANKIIEPLQRKLDDQFPGAQVLLRRLAQGPAINAPLEVRIEGPEIHVLKKLGNEVQRRLLETPGVVHVRKTLSEFVPKLWFALNEEMTHLSGLSLTKVAKQLQDSVDGVVQGSVLEETKRIPIRVMASDLKRGDVQALSSWPIIAGQGEWAEFGIPLSAYGRPDLRPVPSVIPRRNGVRVNTIETYIRDNVLPEAVLNKFKQQLKNDPLDVPPGYRITFGGESEKRSESVNKILALMGPIFVLLLVSMVMAFNSFRLSFIVVLVAIQSIGLGMLALFLSGYPFGLMAIIGLMGLIGLAINAAIVILAELQSDPEAVRGDKDSTVKTVLKTGRHILSTAVTTTMGFVPLILGGGGFWPPFAVVVVGGTVLCTLLSFYFVPVMFHILMKRRNISSNSRFYTDIVDQDLPRES